MTTASVTEGFCVVCGRPFASIFVYTTDREEPKFVHSACYNEYAHRLLRAYKESYRDSPLPDDA